MVREEQEMVSTFNTDLLFRKAFKCNVYEVEKNGEIYILKFRFYDPRDFLGTEAKALKLAYNLTGITHLVEEYHQKGELQAILKEYAKGRTLREGEHLNENLQKQLSNTVYNFHQKGISGLDILKSENIIVSDDESNIFLFDFDRCIFREEEFDFENLREKDLFNLEYICPNHKMEAII